MQNPNPQDQPVNPNATAQNEPSSNMEQQKPLTEQNPQNPTVQTAENKVVENQPDSNKVPEAEVKPNVADSVEDAQKKATEMAEQGAEKMQEIGKEGMQKVGNVVQGVLSPKGPDENQPPVRQDEKNYAAIGYVPFVALISIIVKPDSAYVRMHAKQALLLAILFFFGGILAAIVSLFGIIGQLLAFVLGLVPLASLIIAGYSMYLAYMGFWWKIPVLSTIANIIPVEMMAKVSKENITGQAGVAKEDYDVRQEALTKEKKEASAPEPTVEVKNTTVAPETTETVTQPPVENVEQPPKDQATGQTEEKPVNEKEQEK